VASEPDFAAAWLAMADAHSKLDRREGNRAELILESARKALEVDPSLGEAHALIAGVHVGRWEWLDAEREFRRALALRPGDAGIRAAYGAFLAQAGFTDRATEQLSSALDRDPLSSSSHAALAQVLLSRGELDSALTHTEQARDEDGAGAQNDQLVVQILLLQGRLEKARDRAHEARQAHGRWFWPEPLLDALEVPSNSAAAVDALAAMEEAGQLAPVHAMAYYAWLGELDPAYRSGTAALRDKALSLQDLWTPGLVAFREDSRFAEMIQRTGLSDYWQAYGLPDACSLVDQTVQCE